jgi:major intracellular serine protease
MADYFLPDFKVHDVGSISSLSQIYPQNVRDLNVPKVWTKTKGKGVTVAVLDTGCPKNHPDLKDNVDISASRSFINNEDIYDLFVGHGSHVSGTIGAVDNAEGIVGIAPEVRVVCIKVLDKNGSGGNESLIRGLLYCLKDLKPDVINMSLGSPYPMPDVENILKELHKQNIPVVCSAGNNGQENVLYPAKYDDVIAVGSYTSPDLKDRSQFSSYGAELDLMAPGDEILSTYVNGGYAVMSGTSMAAPAVTGVIALLIAYHKQNNRTLTVNQIKKLMYASCIDLGEVGFDKQHGWGVVNPETLFNAEVQGIKIKKKVSFLQKLKDFFKNLFK